MDLPGNMTSNLWNFKTQATSFSAQNNIAAQNNVTVQKTAYNNVPANISTDTSSLSPEAQKILDNRKNIDTMIKNASDKERELIKDALDGLPSDMISKVKQGGLNISVVDNLKTDGFSKGTYDSVNNEIQLKRGELREQDFKATTRHEFAHALDLQYGKENSDKLGRVNFTTPDGKEHSIKSNSISSSPELGIGKHFDNMKNNIETHNKAKQELKAFNEIESKKEEGFLKLSPEEQQKQAPEMEKAFLENLKKKDALQAQVNAKKPSELPVSHYGQTNKSEYFAESVAAYMNKDDLSNPSREELKKKDPEMYKTIDKFMANGGTNIEDLRIGKKSEL